MAEGFAVTILEAMSCGLPVLVADSGESAAARLALGPEFRFTSGDARDLAARLDHHIEHAAELAAARERTHAMARAYDFETSVARLVDVYHHVLRAERTAAASPIAAAG